MNGPEIKADGLTELRKLTGLVYSNVDSSDAKLSDATLDRIGLRCVL